MKTPDMTKENNFVLREAAKAACDGYYTHLQNGGKGDPAEERWIDALFAGADAIAQVVVLESRLAQVERERDAAIHDCAMFPCRTCLNEGKAAVCYTCHGINGHGQVNYEWRGVCEEKTKEETK